MKDIPEDAPDDYQLDADQRQATSDIAAQVKAFSDWLAALAAQPVITAGEIRQIEKAIDNCGALPPK